jgi:hypothetical protein
LLADAVAARRGVAEYPRLLLLTDGLVRSECGRHQGPEHRGSTGEVFHRRFSPRLR